VNITNTKTDSQKIPKSDLIYTPKPGIINDIHDAEGNIREHWSYLLNSLKTLGSDALDDRQAKALRILRDDGATYNIYSEQASPSRTWELDLVPSLISSDEWAKIESGILERAELFNLLLKDIYGPRDLVRHGIIPPEALFCHPGFLRACQSISLPGDHDLIIHAVDLMRGANGDICVLTDRTQSPSGAGYALENRTVMSRVLPSLFRDSHVHRLAAFFQRLRAKLTALSPNQDQPRIVILTPGAHNETYFEHAYLANYLGFHLVQSNDLLVRNGYVWMKSLDGLSRVDVILRRVDDWFCDPVELRSDSQLGIANLLEVIRSKRVVIANPLGSGILENPVLLKYLPAIAKALNGRELRLNSVPTYWCADANDMSYIKDNLSSLVIKPIYRSNDTPSISGAEMNGEKLEVLFKQLQRNPMQYVAQPILNAGHLPSYQDRSLQSKPAILRSFAAASGTSYSVMPGGLTRVGVQSSSFIISSQAGSQSKDTWVIASEPERISTNNDTDNKIQPSRIANLVSLPSRVVENLFWMGRYAERAEASLRLLRTIFIIFNGEETISTSCKRTLLTTVTELTTTQPGFINANDALIAKPEEELLDIVKNKNRTGSIYANLNAMLYCAEESKELLSSDMLRVINDIRDALSALDSTLSGNGISAPEEALDPLVTALMALAGLTQESMVRSTGWRFMEIGRRLERALQSTTIINNLVTCETNDNDENIQIYTILLSLEVLISYRRRYGARMNVSSSLDLVMKDTSNPRSLLFQLEQLNQHICALSKNNNHQHELMPEERSILEAETIIKLSLLNDMNVIHDGERLTLRNNLEKITHLLRQTSDFISDKYFDHRQSSQQLVRSVWENN
jgi:uncharacterized circularly permuted ATP-grasp superfamily protein/uncharacterized alpha-E superfamily protein